MVDFSATLAGPSAARHLADFGAQVIKVESQAHPDTLRVGMPYAGGVRGLNRSGYFATYNAGKLSFALNLTRPGALEIVRRLVERSDVVLESFAPGVLARLGLTYELMSQWNPRIVMASHSLQGQWGPLASQRGYGQIASAMSGWYDLTGQEGEEPVGPYSAYTDFISWPFLVIAILVALEVREVTGRGLYIDHAQMESSLQFLAPLLLELQLTGRVPSRRGNREDYAAPNNVYPCRGDDRWLAITVSSDAEWQALCQALGHPEAAHDPRFATLAARKAHEGELDALLSAWTAPHDPLDLMERLQAAGVAAGVVAKAEDLLRDPQLQHRGTFRRLEHPEIGRHAVLGHSFRIEGLEAGPTRAAPLLGEHTYQLCRELLGLSDDEIADYAARGVLE